jgi:protein-L-isoaspartate O-methyltransferase
MTNPTTNIKPNGWTTTAGPRQSKQADKAIKHFRWQTKGHIEISDSGRAHIVPMLGEMCAEALEADAAIFEQFGGQITRENYQQVIDAYNAALKAVQLPEVDNRTTPEERAEREARWKLQEAHNREQAELKAEQTAEHVERLQKEYPWARPDDGKLSFYARAAKNLKTELSRKWPDVRWSVTSESYSMGNSVRIGWTDGPTRDQVREISAKYQYGSYDHQQDMATSDSSAEGKAVEIVLGRARHVSESRKISEPAQNAILELIERHGAKDRDGYSAATLAHEIAHDTDLTAGTLVALEPEANRAGWSAVIELPPDPEPTQANAQPIAENGHRCDVQKHFHTKRQADFWLVVLADKVERDTFEQLRDACKTAGGWYSRKFGRCPGGFAFNNEDDAQAFAAQLRGNDDEPGEPDGTQPTAPSVARTTSPKTAAPKTQDNGNAAQVAESLRALADRLQKKIDDCFRERQTNTNKRASQASSKRCDGQNMQATQDALNALADAWEAGTLPPGLKRYRTTKAVGEAVRQTLDWSQAGYYSLYRLSGNYSDLSPAACELRDWLQARQDPAAQAEREAQRKLQRLTDELAGLKIDGYFPTPPAVVARVIEAANIEPGQTVLEPSAGCGYLAEAAEQAGGQVHCIEVNHHLAEILQAKGLNVDWTDFTDAARQLGKFDRIVMNPPFEKGQDREHVRQAFDLLAPGGRLVAITSPGPFFHSTRAAQEFREWFDEAGGIVEELPADAFKASDNPTGVATRLLILDSPEDETDPEPEAQDETTEAEPEQADAEPASTQETEAETEPAGDEPTEPEPAPKTEAETTPGKRPVNPLALLGIELDKMPRDVVQQVRTYCEWTLAQR